MRNPRSNLNLLAVSLATGETAINTEQATDISLLVSDDDYINLQHRRESNAGEANGKEEADAVDDLGATSEAKFTFAKLQPHHAALLLGYGLGSVTTAAAGSGYAHTITPIAGDLDEQRSNPSLTGVQRIGNSIVKRRFASLFVDGLSLKFARDEWVSGSGAIKGTGKHTDNITEETVSALNNATSLPLAANAVAGATAQARLDNVQVVRAATVGDQYEFCVVTAVSSATPAVITIASLGGDGLSSLDYKILYVPTEPAWCTFPARITETPLRVSQMCLHVGGNWDGSAFVGGKSLSSVLESLEYELKNNMDVIFTPCAGGVYAGQALRSAREQTIKLTRQTRDFLLQNYILQNETFGLHVLCEGAEFDTGHKYTLELIFPRVSILEAPFSSKDGRITEAGNLQVLEDDTYGSVIARVKNLQATVAA
ncbi:MAG: hypothetical protein C4563_06440 [Desulfobulbus sp.]|jgi:hypothetical protein|nr:MAG: hypothetical protein C4563_06440 [Desulfobulbus sp.]